MITVSYKKLELQKLYPLTISRGTSTSSENLFVTISDGERCGVGELSPAIGKEWTADRGLSQLQSFASANLIDDFIAPHAAWQRMRDAGIDPPAMAAVDVALWDLLAKQAKMPLYRLLGLPRQAVPTSVTIGINPAEVTKQRVPDILARTGAKCLKIKLGSPDGLDADKAHFEAAAFAAKPFGARLRVDANGGWDVDGAMHMLRWLSAKGVDYVEQPLPEGAEEDLPRIFEMRPLPIFADESCRFAQDVPKLAGRVDGVNVKLMKCGGITDALRIVAAARAHGMGTMIGCMSESSIAISAGASLGALFDYIDLDSHLNLAPDPARGAEMRDGVVLPREVPGHGAELCDA